MCCVKMGKPKKNRGMRKQMRLDEVEEISLLNSWIESQKPDSGSNPLSFASLPKDSKIGKFEDGKNGTVFSRYAGVRKFDQLPISDKTKRGLKDAKYKDMTDVQRAAVPHALCGRDILGAARTGSGKTLAFVIPVSFRFNSLFYLRYIDHGYFKFWFFCLLGPANVT